jgi:hypothetical protein
LVATLSTDTKPSPTWNSAAASTNYYRPSSPTTPANTASYKQQSIGSNRSAYGLAWQPSQHSTIVVTPPPPPPPPGNKNRSSGSIATRKNSSIDSITSSVSVEGGGGVTVHRTPPPPSSVVPVAAGAAATPSATSAPQQEAGEYSFPNQGYVPVPPHVMQHPLPTGPAIHAMPHLPPVIAPPAFENGQITTLYIRNIPLNMNELGLLHFYMPFGAIVATKVLRNLDSMRSRGAGFVEFFTRKESDAALQATHKTASPDGRELLVQYAPRQLHTSRGAAAMAPPVWPVMPYPSVAAPHVAVAPLGPQSGSVAPLNTLVASATSSAALSVPIAAVQPPSADVAGLQALALGHPVHPQAAATAVSYPGQQSYNPYNQMMPYHPAHLTGTAPAPAATAGWQHPQQQRYTHSYYPQHYYPRYHPQHYYPGSRSSGNSHTNTPSSATATMPPAGSKPASSGDSAGSVTSSTTAVRRPGDPVVVVYGNQASQKHQQQQQPLPLAFHPGHYAMPPYSTTTTGYSTPASGYRGNTVNAGGRYPLRNLSNMNRRNGNSQPQSTVMTPEGVMSLGVQKHIAGSGGNGGSGSGVGLDGNSGDPFPRSLSPSAMEAICSRVKAAARDVNDANAAARAMHKKPPALSIDVGTSGNSSEMSGNATPDLVVKSNNNVVSSVNTVESQDSIDSVADSVASCATGGKSRHRPAADKVEVDVSVGKN